MNIHCPSCGRAFEAPEDQATASLTCPSCGRRVVLRDTRAASPVGDQTVPFDPATVPAAASGLLTPRPTAPVLALPRDGRVSVAVISGPLQGRVRVLDGPRLVIGREGGPADLTVPTEISRQHATVECYGGAVLLRDLDSRNGTFVGRARIEAREVADQTEFRLGGTDFLLIVTERG